MRPLLLCLLTLCLAAPVAWADEDADAARAGRLLLSPDPAHRAEGEAMLLARIEQGGDMTHFVRRMSSAIAEWANRHERLLEVWIEQAMTSDAEERDRAVRLIHALGESATRRLVAELRFARMGMQAPQSIQVDGVATEQARVTNDVSVDADAVPHTPQVYDVSRLIDDEMNPLEIKSFLERTANASRVASLGRQYVVFAATDGHAALKDALANRQSKAQVAEAATVERKPAAPQDPRKDDGDEDEGETDEMPPREATLPDGPRFRVEPILVRVPEDDSLAGYMKEWKGTSSKKVQLLLGARTSNRNAETVPLVGDLEEARMWRRAAPRLPDARTTKGGSTIVVVGHEANAFVGEAMQYRRNLRREKSGGWGVEQATLKTGLDLDVTLTPAGDKLNVAVRARMSDVSKPLATTEQTPEAGAEPVELDVVEWNRQSRSIHFTVPSEGGGALLVMPDPTKADGLVLIVLTIEPALENPAQQIMINGMPQPAGGDRDG